MPLVNEHSVAVTRYLFTMLPLPSRCYWPFHGCNPTAAPQHAFAAAATAHLGTPTACPALGALGTLVPHWAPCLHVNQQHHTRMLLFTPLTRTMAAAFQQ